MNVGRIPPLNLVGERDNEHASKMAVQKKAGPSAKTNLVKPHRKFRNLTTVE